MSAISERIVSKLNAFVGVYVKPGEVTRRNALPSEIERHLKSIYSQNFKDIEPLVLPTESDIRDKNDD